MNTDQAKQLADNALAQLIEALEKGQSETLKTYLATISRFHRYSWNNCLLIAMQRPAATHVAGFHAWPKFQRHVRKGEKGIAILAPMVGKAKNADASELTEDQQTRLFGFRVIHVFDILQTDGEPIAEFAQVKGDPQGYTERLKAVITEAGISLDYSDKIAPAKGVSSGGAITILPGMEPAEEFSVLVHEYAHEKLHRDERRAKTDRTIRETEAEAVAFVVCQAIGLDTSAAASDYIQIYRGDKATLVESLALVQNVATAILSKIDSA